MSDDCSGNPKWLAVAPTIKDRYLSNLSHYPDLNDNEQSMMGDLHQLIDDVATLHSRVAELEKAIRGLLNATLVVHHDPVSEEPIYHVAKYRMDDLAAALGKEGV